MSHNANYVNFTKNLIFIPCYSNMLIQVKKLLAKKAPVELYKHRE